MGLSRHLNREGIAHANADSITHAQHVRQRSETRHVEWNPEPLAENRSIEFGLKTDGLNLDKGAYFIGMDTSEQAVTGANFESHCSAINWQRQWHFSGMKRKGKVCQVRRKRTTPACEEFVVNLSPWQMKFLNGELASWESAGVTAAKRKEILTSLVNELRRSVVSEFRSATGRDVVASYIHFDSNKIHLGVVHSRIGPDNLLIGDKRLGTVGPWSTAKNRIEKLGLRDAGDRRLAENLEKFRARFGKDRQPLDIQLHDRLDERFDAIVQTIGGGAEQRYAAAKDYYKAWKIQSRRDAALRTPSSQRIALETLRLLMPLLPPQLRAALAIARTALQAFQTIGLALDAVNIPIQTGQTKQPEINRAL